MLKIGLPSEEVDVNVHPAKTQVRFRDADAVFRAVQRAVRRSLVDQMTVPSARTTPVPEAAATDSGVRKDWPGAWPTPEQMVRRAQLRTLGTRLPQRSDPGNDSQYALDLTRPPVANDVTAHMPPIESPARAQELVDRPETPIPGAEPVHRTGQIPFLRVVGQLGLTYVVAEGPEGMFLIDQHAAHERVLYEKLMAEKAQARVVSQTLLEPLTLELTIDGASLVQESLEALLVLGFDLEPFGGNTVLVRAVPALLVGRDIQTTFDEIVADLQVGEPPLAGEIEGRIIRRICKRAAIRAGQTLSRQEMEELIRALEACAAPHTCPHGRPTMIHMSATQLAREFGRLG